MFFVTKLEMHVLNVQEIGKYTKSLQSQYLMQIICADLQRNFFHPQLADLQLFEWHKFCASVVVRFRPDWNSG